VNTRRRALAILPGLPTPAVAGAEPVKKGMRVMSVPQNERSGSNASKIWRR